ncbi:hemerythrin domain-containing protein [Actinocatenispora comari]|uniref:Hemerythrin-like domain-containing protein n=1 Tax=Actinocatenispora comari TaxID=2807577 RepID=A0A8J4EPP0_9ACTN|nr:hemerythrin domain-containing protein [Actinocatenispora comari]GIL31881.1 hypothetical protein NUM_71350 [Actinocatenispora comari]
MSTLDMTAMYAMHDALRRDMTHLARFAGQAGDEPRRVLATAVGWDLFKTSLHIHHTAEDDALWPAMRQRLVDRPDELALLDAMEAEHAAIDPILQDIEAALGEPEAPVGDLLDALVTALNGHLEHEEGAALPVIGAFLTPEQWGHFGQVHAQRIGPNAPRLLPWLLDGADERVRATMLSPLPEPAYQAYLTQWQPAYEALELWRRA